MERPEFLNTVTIGDTRRKYRENQKSLDNMMLLVSSGIIQEVFNGDNEWVFNQVMDMFYPDETSEEEYQKAKEHLIRLLRSKRKAATA